MSPPSRISACHEPRRRRPVRAWQLALLLVLAPLPAACNAPDNPSAAQAQHEARGDADAVPPDGPETTFQAAPPRAAGVPGIRMDLAQVDRKSAAYARFKSFVDTAVAGNPGYAFAAADAVLMFRLAPAPRYCELAVQLVERQVTEAEEAIAAGGRPEVAGDSYLHVGPMISDLALTIDTCAALIDDVQRTRWSRYAEQAVWNVWHHQRASWGGRPQAWTGWSTDNPGNNYYYSFVEATMYWALASGSQAWLDELRQKRLPPLRAYFANLPGGGSSEGTGYGAAHMRLFSLYRTWREATGEDLANASPHAADSIDYWVHATVPTADRFAPIGDQSRNSVPELYDYHRRLVLEARQVTDDEARRAVADWWLERISVDRMANGFNMRHDLLSRASPQAAAPRALLHHATGTGHLFARTDWGEDAMWLALVAGPYNESHAHQDQGGFTLFARDWLAVTQNIWTHSGIQQGPEVHNVVRFERADASASQCQGPGGDRVVHQCYPTRSTLAVTPGEEPGSLSAVADLGPAYRGNPAVAAWQRRLDFGGRQLTVRDSFRLGTGTKAVFQLNVPAQPRIDGNVATAGRLRVRVVEPADAVIKVHDWRVQDAQEFRSGWRIDVTGSDTGYVVVLDEVP